MKSFKRQFLEKYVDDYGENGLDPIEQELLKAIEKDDGWINTMDKLPEERKQVLLFGQYNIILAGYLFEGKWYNSDTGMIIYLVITHWRELPNTPKS